MRIAGVVAEYNPFHNGHKYHVEQARALGGCDAVIAVMSGNFVQRGEPAAFDKWARARMALLCGVDAVFELPALYALQSADWFATGGVSVLNGLGADCLCFGAETPDLARLTEISRLWANEPADLRDAIKKGLNAGKSHPKARAEALETWLNDAGSAEALAAPNSVLGAMYLGQLRAMNSDMEPLAIQRVEAGYNDEQISGSIASATAIRKALAEGNGSWRQAVPPAVAAAISAETERGTGPIDAEDFAEMLLYALRTGRGLPDEAEGLGNRMRKAAFSAGSAGEFYGAAKSKRYTMARIKRAAMQALIGITHEDIALMRSQKPIYARLLGYSRRVDGLINELARRSSIPFVVRTSDMQTAPPAMVRLWQIDLAAGDIYALACKNPALRQGKRDFTEKLIVL